MPHTKIPMLNFCARNFLQASQLQTLWDVLVWPEFPGVTGFSCLGSIRAESGLIIYTYSSFQLFFFFFWTYVTIAPRSSKSALVYCMKVYKSCTRLMFCLCFNFLKSFDWRLNIFWKSEVLKTVNTVGLVTAGTRYICFSLQLQFCPLQIQGNVVNLKGVGAKFKGYCQ